MNDDDLTTRFHEAFDDAVPDPHLYRRVESNVSRNTLTRRIALGVAALAIPATAFAAVSVLPTLLDDRSPDVAIDPSPSASATDSPAPDATANEAAYVAPIDLSPTVFAWAESNRIVLGDKNSTRTSEFVIEDADDIVAVAGQFGSERQHVAAVVRYLDQDGAPQFRVDRLSWDRDTAAPIDIEYVQGQMFSQVADATYSAAFDNNGRLVVFFTNPVANPNLNVATFSLFPDVAVLGGKTIAVDSDDVRLDGFDETGLAYATTGEGALIVVDVEQGTANTTAYGAASSWIFDGRSSRFLLSSDEAIWVVREFPDRGGMREVYLPFDAMALDARDLRLLNGPFGVTHLQYQEQVWRQEGTDWVVVNAWPDPVTTFTTSSDVTRPVAPVNQSGWTQDAITTSTPIDERGAGAISVGMTLAEVRAATGQEVLVGHSFDGFCFTTRINGVEGFSMTFLPDSEGPVEAEDAVLATVESFEDRGSNGNRTLEGVGPGMTEADLLAAYPNAVQSPNKYDPSSSYWDVDFEDGLGIRFNTTEDGIIRSVFGGNGHRLALEGCA